MHFADKRKVDKCAYTSLIGWSLDRAAHACSAIVSRSNVVRFVPDIMGGDVMKVFVSLYEMITGRHMAHGILSQSRDTHVLGAIEGISHAIPISRVYISDNPTCILFVLFARVSISVRDTR